MLDMEWREDDMEKGLDLHWVGEGFLFKESGDEVILPLDWDEIDALISLALAYRELKSTKTRLGLPLFNEEASDSVNNGDGDEVLNYGGSK